jgi:hypothetical protein
MGLLVVLAVKSFQFLHIQSFYCLLTLLVESKHHQNQSHSTKIDHYLNPEPFLFGLPPRNDIQLSNLEFTVLIVLFSIPLSEIKGIE